MSSNECQTQHTHQKDIQQPEMRACLTCHKRSRKPKDQKTSAVRCIHSVGRSSATHSLDHFIKGTRGLSESDRKLQECITEKSLYRDKLEKALAELQKSVSSEPHPLLTRKSKDRVPRVQHDTRRVKAFEPPSLPLDSDADELVETFGMMSIRNDGKRPFHGETATSEYLLNENTLSCGGPPPQPLQLPPEIILANIQFPCPPIDQPPMDMNIFLPFLPRYDKALTLVQNYSSYFEWCAMPVPKADLNRIVDSIYPNGVKTSSLRISEGHGLAVLFMVFLMGTLYDVDIDLAESSARTEEFHSLARAAMTADPVTERTTVQSIQAILLMIWYFRMFPERRSLSYQWALSGFLNKLVQAIGLHRDSSKYVSNSDERQRYEQTFWEFNCVDIWQSYMFGRPTSMTNCMVDCKVPATVITTADHDPNFYVWKYSFARLVSDVVGHISGTATSIVVGETCAAPVVYSDIIRYERLLKDHCIPASFTWPERGEPLPTDDSAGKMFQRFLGNTWMQISIMYLHRSYFWIAILQHAYNPSQSAYAHSVATVFHSAVSISHGMRRLWYAHPRVIERMSPFWSHCMSAALVLGALVAKSPGYRFAENALLHFDETCEMFAEAKDSLQPRNALAAMLKLQRKAHEAFTRFHDTADQLGVVAKPTFNNSTRSSSRSDDQFPFKDGTYAPHVSPDTRPGLEGIVMPSESTLLSHPSAPIEADWIRPPKTSQDPASFSCGLFSDIPIECDMAQMHVGMQNV